MALLIADMYRLSTFAAAEAAMAGAGDAEGEGLPVGDVWRPLACSPPSLHPPLAATRSAAVTTAGRVIRIDVLTFDCLDIRSTTY
ncbi:hypothetical protein ACWDLG_10820 [Nonomuraea sp. NPDC003727]